MGLASRPCLKLGNNSVQLELKNRFSFLSLEDADGEKWYDDEGAVVRENAVENKWKKIRECYFERARDVLG